MHLRFFRKSSLRIFSWSRCSKRFQTTVFSLQFSYHFGVKANKGYYFTTTYNWTYVWTTFYKTYTSSIIIMSSNEELATLFEDLYEEMTSSADYPVSTFSHEVKPLAISTLWI